MKTLLMVLTAAVVCGMSGMLYQKVLKKEKDIAALYIEGFLFFFCMAGVLVLPLIKWRMHFTLYCVILAVCAGVIILTGGFFLLADLRRKKDKKPKPQKKGIVPFYLAGLVFAALIFSFYQFEPSIGADMTAETVFTTLQTNTLFEYNPATGSKLEIGIYPQSKLMIMPVIYSVLYRMSRTDMQFFLYQLIPILIVGLNYMVIWKWSALLFPAEQEEGRERRGLFLLFYGLLVLFGDYLSMTYAYRLLHEAWKGESIFAVIVIPWLAYLCLDILLHKVRLHKLCSIILCIGAGIFLVPWKTAAALEIMIIAFFVLLWLIRRGWQCLKQRH